MDIKLLVNIASRAWAFPILWSLHAGIAGRQAPLLTATGAGRTAFAQSMNHLIKIGLLERNPGYGHPLRPEFRLTKVGKSAAEIAFRIQSAVAARDEELDIIRRTWTLPILSTLHSPKHFNGITKQLSGITDRALSQSLKSMEEQNWVYRSVDISARPPRTTYRAVNTGRILCDIIGL